MFFHSTNHHSAPVNFETALLQGLAPDKGLYFPDHFPQFSPQELRELCGKSLQEIGSIILNKWIGDEIAPDDIKQIVEKALDFPIPLVKVGPYTILELFHGPTMAFKDVAGKTLGQLTSHVLKKQKRQATILVATSGDTGGAVAQGFAGVENVKVVILFPKGKVSQLQEEQLTRVEDNVFAIEVDGVFDECQDFVKRAFLDPDLHDLHLTSANSINIGRLIPQSIYYVYTWTQLMNNSKVNSKELEFIIPSGNLGNATAGLFARQMGLPLHSFIIATNENDPVVKYYETGEYNAQQSISTLSNAMDIGNPSNFSRMLEIFTHNHAEFKKVIQAIKISDKETVETMKKVYNEYNYLLDPHTAVAWKAAKWLSSKDKVPIIISTASPVKFAAEIEKTTGIKVDNAKEIEKLQVRPKTKYEIANNYEEFKKMIKVVIGLS